MRLARRQPKAPITLPMQTSITVKSSSAASSGSYVTLTVSCQRCAQTYDDFQISLVLVPLEDGYGRISLYKPGAATYLLALIVSATFAVTEAKAQTLYGTLVGNITDPGKVLPLFHPAMILLDAPV